MNHNKAFGMALRKQRLSQGRTQEALAHDAELDRTYISLLELGQRSPTLDTVFELCKALKLKPSEILLHTEEIIQQHP